MNNISSADIRELISKLEDHEESLLLTEDVKPELEEVHVEPTIDDLVEDLRKLRLDLEALYATEGNEDFRAGYESGIAKAVSMLENLVAYRYQRRI